MERHRKKCCECIWNFRFEADYKLLINGKSVPYIGIYGTTVTEQLAEEHKMPSGIYVADVDPIHRRWWREYKSEILYVKHREKR